MKELTGQSSMAIAQVSSLSSNATDPLRGFKFAITIQGNGSSAPPPITMGFMTCSGLGLVSDVISYRGGGMNISTQNMPGQVTWNPLMLSRGITLGATQIQTTWLQQIYSLMQGTGSQAGVTSGGTTVGGITKTTDFRSTITIAVLSHPDTGPSTAELAVFTLYNAWPYTISYGDLDAGSSQLFIYQMALMFEGFDAYVGTTPAGLVAAVQPDSTTTPVTTGLGTTTSPNITAS